MRQLEAFEAVITHGGFTRAAEELSLSQPAVTRQIAALEAELRTRLFDRLGRSVHLTAAGEALHGYAAAILRSAEEARQAVGDIEAGNAGRIAVGASSTLAAYVLPRLLRRFREENPGVQVAIHTGPSADVIEMVRTNEADVGLVTTDVTDAGLATVMLADYATVVVVPSSHPLAVRKAIGAAELADVPLILMEEGTSLRTYVDRVLSSAGVRERVAMEIDNVEAIKRMIEAGIGASLLPEVSVHAEAASGRLAALRLTDAPRSVRRIVLIHRRDKYVTHALRAFIGLVREEVRSP